MEAKRATGGRPKNLHAVELGKLGGRLGGQARAAALSSERRVRIARQAAQKRWAKRGVEPARRVARGRPARNELESRVLAAATHLFADQGFHAVTMRDVAAQARVGLSTIYLSFADKRDLYVECSLSLAAAYARKQHEMMETVRAGAERIYAFAYTYCRIQSDPAFPKLIHRLLMDQDLDVITPLAEGIFQQQFIELRASVTLIVGEAKADFATYSIFAAGFGLIRLAPMSAYIAALGPAIDGPQAIVRGTLSLIFPLMDWGPIDAALRDRLEAAYSP